MKIVNEYYCVILSSCDVYRQLHTGWCEHETSSASCEYEADKLKPYIFSFVRRNSTRGNVPDYVFKKIQEDIFTQGLSIRELYIKALGGLAEMLIWRDNHLYVKDADFEEWQHVVTRVSPLHIISYFLYSLKSEDKVKRALELFEYSVLPSIFNKNLTFLMKDNVLNDLHIHLNGSTEADHVWLDLLNNISDFSGFIQKSAQNSSACEQFMDIDTQRIQNDLYELRNESKAYKDKLTKLVNFGDVHKIKDEMEFFIKLFDAIDDKSKNSSNLYFYLYILNYNYFYKLLVQQINQVGFDQFQNITLNEMRELTEKNYSARMKQVQTVYTDVKVNLEGRFAPKATVKNMEDLLDQIFKSEQTGAERLKHLNLNLIAHFIKKLDNKSEKENICRHAELRYSLETSLDVVLTILKHKKYQNKINGFDAASNELHAPPEVFAAVFSKLRDKGYSNFTFHAGEDFIDLVSGIRYIYEVVEFLEFKHGNRIGHGTAIGIDPRLWKERLGSDVVISRGEYLDNLVFVYSLLINNHLLPLHQLEKIKSKIRELANKIYDGIAFNLDSLVAAWKLRKHDPRIVLEEDNAQTEFITSHGVEVCKLFYAYHYSSQVKESCHELIQIKTDFLEDELLIGLQNILIQKLNDECIVIESLVTSNVRISYYNNYAEHHIFRWLGLNGKFKGAPLPTVVLGTDNPGISVTNMRNEIVHIYLVMKNFYKLPEQECWKHIEQLVKNNQIYLFSQA